MAAWLDADLVERLVAATLAGSVLGLNRFLRHKPIGLRTHGLVALNSALVVVASLHGAKDLGIASREVQGILTGMGFLGAGVILHPAQRGVRGLTTAAGLWLTAGLGCVLGAAQWGAALLATLLTFAVLVGGRLLEETLARKGWRHRPHRRHHHKPNSTHQPDIT
jgi:putative Mg2+ transporter-C (MgtC) family protein